MEDIQLQIKNIKPMTLESYYTIVFAISGAQFKTTRIKDFGEHFMFFLADDATEKNVSYIIRNDHKGDFSLVKVSYIKIFKIKEGYYFIENLGTKMTNSKNHKGFCEHSNFFPRWCFL